MKLQDIKPYGEEGTRRSQVESLFNNISKTYDRLNHLLSFGIDRVWRRNAVDELMKQQPAPKHILDIATGTGDLAMLACRKMKPEEIIGCDISEGMMEVGRKKVAEAGMDGVISFCKEDCSCLTFDDCRFDAVMTAFALRNFVDIEQCLREMHRVLRPGCKLVAIDLCAPVSFPMKQLFYVYKKVVMPMMGRLVSHDDSAYSYLPQTMDVVPQGEAMLESFRKAGFRNAKYRRLLFGMCIMYVAIKD